HRAQRHEQTDEPETNAAPTPAERPPLRALALQANGPHLRAPFRQNAAIAAHGTLARCTWSGGIRRAKSAALDAIAAIALKRAAHSQMTFIPRGSAFFMSFVRISFEIRRRRTVAQMGWSSVSRTASTGTSWNRPTSLRKPR